MSERSLKGMLFMPITGDFLMFRPVADINTARPRRSERFARFGKYSFWIWVGYQTIKGTLTTTFIWVPLIYMHFQG